jgi:hypothetical protein
MTRIEIETKLNGVLQKMLSQCEDQREIEQLRAAQIFRNVKDMPMEMVGISVPIGTNRVHVSFTLDYFRETTLEVLAAEGLEDLHRAKATDPKGPKG